MVVSSVLTKCNRSLWLATVIKSHDVQKKDPNPGPGVKEVDSHTFDTVVSRSNRHAFILFYSDECRHCRAFIPVWMELGAKLQDENIDIVMIEGKHNMWPQYTYPVDRYPTMYWKFADKRTPDKYTGARTLKDLMQYVAGMTDLNNYDRKGNPRPKKIV